MSMRGNQAFMDSQRAADAASNARAKELMEKYPEARAYYEALTATCTKMRPLQKSGSEQGEFDVKETERLLWNFASGVCVYSDNTTRGLAQLNEAIVELAAFIDGKVNRPGAVTKLLERRSDIKPKKVEPRKVRQS